MTCFLIIYLEVLFIEEHMFSFEKKDFWETCTSPPAYLCLCADMVFAIILGELLPNENISENTGIEDVPINTSKRKVFSGKLEVT